jgi:hypothetical protein
MMKNLTLRWVFMYELLPQDLRTALSDINLWLSGAPPVGADPSLRAAPAAVYEHIDRTFSLHQTSEAHEYLESGMATGNVLIDVQ